MYLLEWIYGIDILIMLKYILKYINFLCALLNWFFLKHSLLHLNDIQTWHLSLSVLKHYIGACVYLVSRDVLAQDLIPIALSFGWRRENVLFQSVHSSFPLSYRWSKWKSRLTYILWKVRQQKENSNTHGQTSSSVNPSESDQFRTTW